MKIRFGNDKNKHVQIKMSRPRPKKTCNGCRALIEGSCGDGCTCYLGYDISHEGTPKEDCPKPHTNTEMVELHRAGKKSWKKNTS